MKRILFILLLSFPLYFVSCNNDDEPEKPGTEEPQEPEYDKNTQIYYAGVIWDKKITKDYCSLAEAKELAEKAGKKLPTEENFKELFKSRTFDDNLNGYWFGEDSELKSSSSKSLFIGLLGYKTDKGNIYDYNKKAWAWSHGEDNGVVVNRDTDSMGVLGNADNAGYEISVLLVIR